ncbi:hypothetical protein Sjap_004683 [Stephania japonica]|uniref:Uncharacterized protein n=1 Tax=Stephania japonica TaxID=461633 RepID=A0AAP0K504_9MAGN
MSGLVGLSGRYGGHGCDEERGVAAPFGAAGLGAAPGGAAVIMGWGGGYCHPISVRKKGVAIATPLPPSPPPPPPPRRVSRGGGVPSAGEHWGPPSDIDPRVSGVGETPPVRGGRDARGVCP